MLLQYHSFHICQKILLDLVLLFALSNSCFGGTWLSIRVCAIVWLVMGSWKDRFNWEYSSEKNKEITSRFHTKEASPNITDL